MAQSAMEPMTTLHLRVVDTWGAMLPANGIEVSVIDLERPTDPPAQWRLEPSIRVRSSRYLVTLFARGFAKRTDVIDVLGKETFVLMAMNVARLSDAEPRTIFGNIAGVSDTSGIWLRLIPVLNGQPVVDRPIEKDGSFVLSHVAAGEYVLLVLNHNQLVETRSFRCCDNHSVRLQSISLNNAHRDIVSGVWDGFERGSLFGVVRGGASVVME